MAEGGVGEHRADLIGIDSGAPVVGHRGGLERKPSNRSDEGDDAGDQDDSAHCGGQRKPQPLRRIGPKIGAHAERQHDSQEMGEAAYGERGHGRPKPAPPSRARLKIGGRTPLYIFMPFMAPPVPPVPLAPIPITLNSTSTGPACSKLSVALTLSPFIKGWVRWVNIT